MIYIYISLKEKNTQNYTLNLYWISRNHRFFKGNLSPRHLTASVWPSCSPLPPFLSIRSRESIRGTVISAAAFWAEKQVIWMLSSRENPRELAVWKQRYCSTIPDIHTNHGGFGTGNTFQAKAIFVIYVRFQFQINLDVFVIRKPHQPQQTTKICKVRSMVGKSELSKPLGFLLAINLLGCLLPPAIFENHSYQ